MSSINVLTFGVMFLTAMFPTSAVLIWKREAPPSLRFGFLLVSLTEIATGLYCHLPAAVGSGLLVGIGIPLALRQWDSGDSLNELGIGCISFGCICSAYILGGIVAAMVISCLATTVLICRIVDLGAAESRSAT